MLFNSLAYLIFLPVAWVIFWAIPARRRLDWLLIASYFFYASWSLPYAAMIFGLVVVNYVFGLVLGRATSRQRTLLHGRSRGEVRPIPGARSGRRWQGLRLLPVPTALLRS